MYNTPAVKQAYKGYIWSINYAEQHARIVRDTQALLPVEGDGTPQIVVDELARLHQALKALAARRVAQSRNARRKWIRAILAERRKAERKLILEKAWAEIERDLAQRERAQSPPGYMTPPLQVRVMRPARIAFPTLSELLALPPPPPQQPEVRLMRPNPNVVATFAQFPGTIENHFAEIAPTVPNSPAEEEEGQGGGN